MVRRLRMSSAPGRREEVSTRSLYSSQNGGSGWAESLRETCCDSAAKGETELASSGRKNRLSKSASDEKESWTVGAYPVTDMICGMKTSKKLSHIKLKSHA
jgi:hypothetical protein